MLDESIVGTGHHGNAIYLIRRHTKFASGQWKEEKVMRWGDLVVLTLLLFGGVIAFKLERKCKQGHLKRAALRLARTIRRKQRTGK